VKFVKAIEDIQRAHRGLLVPAVYCTTSQLAKLYAEFSESVDALMAYKESLGDRIGGWSQAYVDHCAGWPPNQDNPFE